MLALALILFVLFLAWAILSAIAEHAPLLAGPYLFDGPASQPFEISNVLHKGGSAPKVEKQKIPDPPPLPPPPPPPKPPAPLPPPPTTSSVDVKQAESDQKRQAAKRRGYNATILAGESAPDVAPSGKSTLLG